MGFILNETLPVYSGGAGHMAGARLKAASIAQAPARQVVYIKNAPMFVRVAEGECMIAATVCDVLGLVGENMRGVS